MINFEAELMYHTKSISKSARIAFVILVLLLFNNNHKAYSQTELRGIVVEQNSNQNKLSGVVLKTDFSNKSTTSDDGKFVLSFDKLFPENNVNITVSKDNWVVVNKESVNVFLPEAQSDYEHKIILCKRSIYESTRNSYSANISKAIKENFERKLNEIKGKYGDDYKRIYELRLQYHQLSNQSDSLTEYLTGINYDDITPQEKNAFELLKNGKYNESINLRESFKSIEFYRKAKEEKEQYHEENQESKAESEAKSFHKRNLNQLVIELKLQYEFEKAQKILELIASTDTNDFSANYNYAHFLQEQNLKEPSIQYYLKASNIDIDYALQAETQHNLALLYMSNYDYESSIYHITNAVSIYQNLSETNQIKFEPLLAKALIDFGKLYQNKYEYYSSLEYYDKALAIYKKLATTNPGKYEPKLALTQNLEGYLDKDKGEFDNSLNAYLNAKEILERFVKIQPMVYGQSLAQTYNYLGSFYQDQKQYTQALSYFNQVLEINQKLSAYNPAVYDFDLGSTLNYLGICYKDNDDIKKSMECHELAKNIFSNLVKCSPNSDIFISNLAFSYNNIASINQKEKDYETAIANNTEALKLFQKIAIDNTYRYDIDCSVTYNLLGSNYGYLGKFDSAWDMHIKAIKIIEALFKKNSYAYLAEYGRTVTFLGLVQKSDYKVSRQPLIDEYFEEAKTYLNDYEGNSFVDMVLNQIKELEFVFKNYDKIKEISTLQSKIKTLTDFKEKIIIQRKIIDSYISLMKNKKDVFVYELGVGKGNLSWYLIMDRQFKEAEKVAREALFPSQYLKPEDYDKKIEWVYSNLALSLLFEGKYNEAEKIYLEYKDKSNGNVIFKDTFLDDLTVLEKNGITNQDVSKIREILSN